MNIVIYEIWRVCRLWKQTGNDAFRRYALYTDCRLVKIAKIQKYSLTLRYPTSCYYLVQHRSKQVVEEFRQTAASPSCHPLQQRMDSSDLDPMGPRVTVSPQTASRSVHPCLRTPQQSFSQCFSVGWTTPPTVLALRDLDPYLIHGSLGPAESIPKWHLDQFTVFAQLTRVPDT